MKPFPLRGLACLNLAAIVVLLALSLATRPAVAADRERIGAFLNVTGFDVALDSIALSAKSAPRMLGLEAEDFGIEWTRMADAVFSPVIMRGMATDILEQTLDDEMLGEAVDFYASDLGQRLVVAENASNSMDDDVKRDQGERIVADLVRDNPGRLEIYKQMNAAIGGAETAMRALEEIQVRFLVAASAAGVVDLNVDVDELRATIRAQEGEMLRSIQQGSLSGAAYTYREFSDADMEAYADALETPAMRRVYELLNAVQYEITANRFEELAERMAGLQPQQDL